MFTHNVMSYCPMRLLYCLSFYHRQAACQSTPTHALAGISMGQTWQSFSLRLLAMANRMPGQQLLFKRSPLSLKAPLSLLIAKLNQLKARIWVPSNPGQCHSKVGIKNWHSFNSWAVDHISVPMSPPSCIWGCSNKLEDVKECYVIVNCKLFSLAT